jgi:drug/metabolite transporter (DMT)-like permease
MYPPFTARVFTNGALASLYLIWGSSYLFIRNMTEAMPPLYMASLRFLLAGGLLYVVARLLGTPRPSFQHWQSAAVLGFLLLAVSNGLLVLGLQYIPTGRTALLGGSYPAFLLVLNWVYFGRIRPSNLALAGVSLGLFSIIILTGFGAVAKPAESAQSLFGSGLILTGNLLWAFATLLSPRLPQASPLLSSSMQMLMGGFILLTLSLFTENSTIAQIMIAPPKTLWSLLYLVLVTSMIGYSCFSYLARHAQPAVVGTYAFVSPVVAVILGVTVANEVFSAYTGFGAVGCLLGVMMILWGQRPGSSSTRTAPSSSELVPVSAEPAYITQ